MKTQSIRTMKQIFTTLRKHGKTDYRLLFFCNFIANLLVTAFAFLICSSTVQDTFPPGGDSMKQVMMVFILALIGCLVFTVYAAILFFRYKSRELGVLMALGASRRALAKQLFFELGFSIFVPALAGILLAPFLTQMIWQIFRLFLVDKSTSILAFDLSCLWISIVFLAVSMILCFLLAVRFLSRTNVLDVVNEQRRSEPIRDVRSWYLPAGLGLTIFGAVAGYGHLSFFLRFFDWMPPAWMNLLYLPILPGVYMIILHLVIRGQGGKRHRYKGIIARSMMKFQGRQTVNNMLVMTLLIGGACFALFYVPMISVSSFIETDSWERDFSMRLRADQDMPDQKEIQSLASEYRVSLDNWAEAPIMVAGTDGTSQTYDDKTGKAVYAYQEILGDTPLISASDYEVLTGEDIEIPYGRYDPVVSENSAYGPDDNTTLLTNMTTGRTLSVAFHESLSSYILSGVYVLNDEDFAHISEGADDSWKEMFVQFDADSPFGTEAQYHFAQALYKRIVESSHGAGLDASYYSRAVKIYNDSLGISYWADDPKEENSHFTQEESNTFSFKTFWKYMPRFRVMEQNDFFTTMAVLFLTFLFMSIICYTAVLIISYTRSLTVALNNRQVYEDLTRLGAGNEFRFRSVRQQLSKIYSLPAALGMTVILLFFSMILYANDGRITAPEFSGLLICIAFMLVLALIFYLFYRHTLKIVCRMLQIKRQPG